MSAEQATSAFTAAIEAYQRGAFSDAEKRFAEALQLNPAWAEAAYNRALMLLQLNRADEGLEYLNRALEIRPEYAAALCARAGSWAAAGQAEHALRDYSAALTVNPQHLESLNNVAALYRQQGQFTEALASYDRAITVSPDTPVLHYNRGVVLGELKRSEDAIAAYERALTLDARYAEAHYNLGVLLAEINRYDEALQHYDQALAINPSDTRVMNNRGAALLALQRHDDALLCLNLLLAVQPNFVEALNNRAATLRELGRIDDAIADVERALAIDPTNLESNWHRSMLYLLCGDLPRGFALYERRWERGSDAPRRRSANLPLWLGKHDLRDKTILLWGEQGLGDQIMMARYVPLLAERGATVLLEVDAPLITLFRTLKGVKRVGKYGEFGEAAQFQCPMMSLPLAFGTTRETIPANAPYLSVPAARVAYWAEKLGPKAKPRIGVMWSGGQQAKLRNRSIPLDVFSRLFSDDFEWISLQKEVLPSDQPTLSTLSTLRHFGDEQDDFMDAAAICELVDVVVTVDTSIAHLAGALAKPTRVLLPFSADWRWMLESTGTPWILSATLCRQDAYNNWSNVFEQITTDLRSQLLA